MKRFIGTKPTGAMLAACLSLVTVLALAACGGDSATATPTTAAATATTAPGSGDPTATPDTASPAPTNTPGAPVQPEGTLNVALSDISFPATIPSLMPVTPGNLIYRWRVYETPFNWDPEGDLEPRLATEWELNDDATEYTITLREGVQFHGGWGEMTAEDFKWSFDDEIREDSTHSSIGLAREYDTQTEVVDEYTVKVTISSPNIFFFETYFGNAGGGRITVHSKNRAETLGLDAANLDITGGTGPFKFTKWEPGDEVTLEAVPTYYGKVSEFQTVRIFEMKEPATQVAALQSGQVDVAVIPAPLANDVSRADNLEIRGFGVPGSFRLYPQGIFCMTETLDGEPLEPRPGYDPSKPWVGDCNDPESQERARKVRWAMSTAIDRQSMVDNILDGFGQPSYLPEVTPPLLDRIFQDKWIIPYDPDEARNLLTEAGYPNGFDALMRITTGDHPLEAELGQAVAQFLRSVGINVSTEVLTYAGNRGAVVARERSDLWFRSSGGGSGESPEVVQLRRNPENAFNPGMEVKEPLEIIRRMDSLTSEAQLDEMREELYDYFYHSQLIIPVVLGQQIIGVNTQKIGEWPMSSAAGSIGDFENIQRVR